MDNDRISQSDEPDRAAPPTVSKRSRFRFSLRTVLLVTVGLGLWFGYQTRKRYVVDRKELVRHLIATELMHRHWGMANGGQLTPQERNAAAMFGSEWSTSMLTANLEVLRTSPNTLSMHPKEPDSLDQTERDAIARLDRGETEIWNFAWDGSVRYFGTLKASSTCHHCHSQSLYGNPAPGTELAVIRVNVP